MYNPNNCTDQICGQLSTWTHLQSFHMHCQQCMLIIWWHDFIPNATVSAQTELQNINAETVSLISSMFNVFWHDLPSMERIWAWCSSIYSEYACGNCSRHTVEAGIRMTMRYMASINNCNLLSFICSFRSMKSDECSGWRFDSTNLHKQSAKNESLYALYLSCCTAHYCYLCNLSINKI